jgi:alkylation response protein AidB-like acyl-CoA dehydrogenase
MGHHLGFSCLAKNCNRGMPEVGFFWSMIVRVPFGKLNISRRYVTQRKVFGNTLGSQAVVRSKLAAMISRVEAAQQWLENITYQMSKMTYLEQANELAGYVYFLFV